MSQVVIRLRNVSKCFKRYRHPVDRLKELLFPHKSQAEVFWALQDINLEVMKGQTLGIIGQNGSGKSTLLQIVAGTLTPTTGTVEVYGRISALLELGSGFNPEFTGRENVFFNGRLLGLSHAQIAEKFDTIAAFADIGDFIDQPVKTYSSGMFVRLAFAVAVNVDPEILIVDEALAVGDVLFQRKCFAKLEEMSEQGVTILFVSHDLNSVLNLCDRAVLIDNHRIIYEDKPHPVTLAYSALMAQREAESQGIGQRQFRQEIRHRSDQNVPETRIGIGGAELLDVQVLDERGNPTQTLCCGMQVTIRSVIRFHEDVSQPIAGFKIKTLNGIAAIGHSTHGSPTPLPAVAAGTTIVVEFHWACHLAPGNYTLTAGVSALLPDQKVLPLDRRRDFLALTVIGTVCSYGLLAVPVDIAFSYGAELNGIAAGQK
ncbi:MAG: ABC transporter ATP-binding protein [Pseudanabaenaceae cyanobacterium SKYGB_i_bin29]|nr:ABC transporter ATP-binding protein [Pseudanabaenaceae cyanobacterium SKYG29]MDW8422116.1 ABC transporter ATP-binding protein [Pseudanabaenaceae cyanobacterium SKYGB_i_bin29]